MKASYQEKIKEPEPKRVKVSCENKEVLNKLHHIISNKDKTLASYSTTGVFFKTHVKTFYSYNEMYNIIVDQIDVDGNNKISVDEMDTFFDAYTTELSKKLYYAEEQEEIKSHNDDTDCNVEVHESASGTVIVLD
jgi:hypothetical protein